MASANRPKMAPVTSTKLLKKPVTPVASSSNNGQSNGGNPQIPGTGIANHRSIDLSRLEPKILLGQLYCKLPTHWILGTGCLTESHFVFLGTSGEANAPAFSIPLESILRAACLNVWEAEYEANAFSITVKGTAKPVFAAPDPLAQSDWVLEINDVVLRNSEPLQCGLPPPPPPRLVVTTAALAPSPDGSPVDLPPTRMLFQSKMISDWSSSATDSSSNRMQRSTASSD